jgi:hypothetical protein
MRDTPGEQGLDVRIKAALDADERVIWSGHPLPRRIAWFRFVHGGVFGLVFTATLVALVGLQFSGAASIASPWILILLACLGIFPSLGPIWGIYSARRTWYVLTDRRCIIRWPRMFQSDALRFYTPNLVRNMTVKTKADGSGDLIFLQYRTEGTNKARKAEEGFLGVADVRTVEALVRQTLSPEDAVSDPSQPAA